MKKYCEDCKYGELFKTPCWVIFCWLWRKEIGVNNGCKFFRRKWHLKLINIFLDKPQIRE